MVSAFFTIYCTLATRAKNIQNKKMHAEMIAVEARENQIFLPIFFIPSFRQYVNVLSLICDTAFYLILRHNSAVQGDYPFSHPVYNLLTVGNNDYSGTPVVDFFQQPHYLH